MLTMVKDGYIIAKNLISSETALSFSDSIYSKIEHFASSLNVKIDKYLYCTGRWANPSLITQLIPTDLNASINIILQKYCNTEFSLKKTNIIAKSKYTNDEVPFHQDISYSHASPYSLSVWLALNEVDDDNGPLQVIPGSHKWPIKPAVDFWSPDFIDNVRIEYADQIQELCLEAGDAIIFDSRLWHGSKKKYSDNNRFAYVSRWVNSRETFPEIPPPIASQYGMWTADNMVYDILSSNLKNIYNIDIGDKSYKTLDYLKLIQLWQQILKQPDIFQNIDLNQAINYLEHLLILKQATTDHNAGDLAGKVYKNLWNSLLKFFAT